MENENNHKRFWIALGIAVLIFLAGMGFSHLLNRTVRHYSAPQSCSCRGEVPAPCGVRAPACNCGGNCGSAIMPGNCRQMPCPKNCISGPLPCPRNMDASRPCGCHNAPRPRPCGPNMSCRGPEARPGPDRPSELPPELIVISPAN